MVSQAIHAAITEGKHVGVVADDTDVLIMLLYHYYSQSLTIPMILLPTKSQRSVIDIKATVSKIGELCLELLPAHALSGCDQTAMHHGIGKMRVWKAVKNDKCSLSMLGDLTADMDALVSQATKFMSNCYGVNKVDSMTDARVKVWISKTGKKTVSKMPKICSLPSTSESFRENVKRAHLQCAIWKRALQEPPNVDPTGYGWERDEEKKSFEPVTLPSTKKPAPDYIMRVVCCSCASGKPCNTRACGCVSANLGCTMYCNCEGSSICNNKQTIHVLGGELSDHENTDEEELDF